MTSNQNESFYKWDFPIRLGGGELGTPGTGYIARDAWALFLPALMRRVPDALPGLLSQETLSIARKCGHDPHRRPSAFLDPDHALWGCIRRWYLSMNIAFTNDEAFIIACESVDNTIFRAVRAANNGEPLPTTFAKPARIFTTVTGIRDDGTAQGGGTPLAPQFLNPVVASHVFRWAMEVEPEARALQRMLDAVKTDLTQAMAQAKSEAMVSGAVQVKEKRDARHFDWTVRAVVLDERYEAISRDQPDDPRVGRHVKEVCAALGIRAPVNGPGRPQGR
jgi:hypothetical protein